jgi:hypothetical protein
MSEVSDVQEGCRDITPGSDDGDELVAKLLQQFAVPMMASTKDHGAQESRRPSVGARTTDVQHEMESNPTFVGVEISHIQEIDEYEYLPGHDKVQRILSKGNTPRGPYYWVQFKSGDKDLVSSDHM